MQIKDLDPTVELHAITYGPKIEPFTNSLAIQLAKNITEFKERAIDYIDI